MDRNETNLGQFRLDVSRRELSRGGTPIKLGSRALDILCVLAAAKGDVVSKDDLMARVWPGLVVEENNIQVHISALRKALDDGPGGQSHVVTVPGRGYRLVGLQPSMRPVDPKIDQHPAVPATPSIAVLPFHNMSNDPDQDYFADGIVEDIITGLSRIKWFLVIARNSSFTFKGKAIDVKQIGRELGVRYVLEGSVRKAGNRVRITAQLVETETGAHLWAERYDRLLDDIFDVQDELTLSVIGAIEPNLRKAEIERIKRRRPDNLDAYDLVLRALPFVYRMMAEGAVTAIPLLEKALVVEPGYARAHALLAWCYHFRFSRGGLREEDRAAAIRHARAAISAGSDDATTLAIAGLVIWFDQHDARTALDLFDRALAISESDAFALGCSAVALSWMGEPERAIERAQRALRLSPFDTLNYMAYDALSVAYFHAGRYEDACEAAQRAIESNPGFSVPHTLLAAAFVRLGRRAEANAAAHRALALNPTFTVSGYCVTVGHVPGVFESYATAWREAGIPD
jgi:TolB-like protein/Tfp pilus assembly protein PilF